MCLPPVADPLTFWHVAGDIIWRGDGRCTAIDRRQAEGLRELYVDEARAAWAAKDLDASKLSATLWTQLTRAMDAQDTWARLFRREAA